MKITASILMILLLSCKSYELTPGGQQVKLLPKSDYQTVGAQNSLLASIEENKQNQTSIFSKCKSRGEITSSVQNPTEADSDLRNQAAGLGANLAFSSFATSEGKYKGIAYHCDDLDGAVAAQKDLDSKRLKDREEKIARETKQREQEDRVATEKAERERYTKPHYWLYCGSTGRSNVPPSVTKEMLKQFPLEAFDEGGGASGSTKCEDAAFLRNQTASQLGIGCICKYMQIDQKKAESLNAR